MEKKKPTLALEMKEIELTIGKIMRVGVVLAAVFMLFGMGLFFINKGSGYPGATFPTTLTLIFQGTLHFKAYAYMMAGIFFLILTPVLRVIVSIYAFWKEKDFLYVYITSAVLFILIISYLIGHH